MNNNRTSLVNIKSRSPKAFAENQISSGKLSQIDQEAEHLIKLIDRTSEIYKELIAKNINTSSAYKLPEKLSTLTKSISKETKLLKYPDAARTRSFEPLASNEEKLKMLSLMSICRNALTNRISSKQRASQCKSQFKHTSDFSEACHLQLNMENVWNNIRNRVSSVENPELNDKDKCDFSGSLKANGSNGENNKKTRRDLSDIEKLNFNFDHENNENNEHQNITSNKLNLDYNKNNNNNFKFTFDNYFSQQKNEEFNSNLVKHHNADGKGKGKGKGNKIYNRNFIGFINYGNAENSKEINSDPNTNKNIKEDRKQNNHYKKLSSNIFHGRNGKKFKKNLNESGIKEDLDENASESYQNHNNEKAAKHFKNDKSTKVNNFATINNSHKNFQIDEDLNGNFAGDAEDISDAEPDSSRAFNPQKHRNADPKFKRGLEIEGISGLGTSSIVNTAYADNDKSSLFLLKKEDKRENRDIKFKKEFKIQSNLISNSNLLVENKLNETKNNLNSRKRRSINSIILKRTPELDAPKKTTRKKMQKYRISPRRRNSESHLEKNNYIGTSIKNKNHFFSYYKGQEKIITEVFGDHRDFNSKSSRENGIFKDKFSFRKKPEKSYLTHNIKKSGLINNSINTFSHSIKNKRNPQTQLKIKNNNSPNEDIKTDFTRREFPRNNFSISPLSLNFCRICKEDDNEPENRLISICNCTGLVKYAHITCSSKYIRDMSIFKENSYTCEICKSRYLYVINKKYQWRALKHSLKFVRFIVKLITLVFIATIIKYLLPAMGFLIVDEFVNNIIFWVVFFLIMSLVYVYGEILGFDILETWTFFDNSEIKESREELRKKPLGDTEFSEDRIKVNFLKKGKMIREELRSKRNEKNFDDVNKINCKEDNLITEIDEYDIISPERKQLGKSEFTNNINKDKLFQNTKTQCKTNATVSLRKSKSASPNKKRVKSILQSERFELFPAIRMLISKDACGEYSNSRSKPNKDSNIKSFRSNSILRIRFKNEFIPEEEHDQDFNGLSHNFNSSREENENSNPVNRIKHFIPKKTSLFEQIEIQKRSSKGQENFNVLNSNKSKRSEFNITLKAIGCDCSPKLSNSYQESQEGNKHNDSIYSLPNDEFNFENLNTVKKGFNMLSGFYSTSVNTNNFFLKENKQNVFSPKVKSSFLRSKNNFFKDANNDTTSRHKRERDMGNAKSNDLQDISFSFDINHDDNDNAEKCEE